MKIAFISRPTLFTGKGGDSVQISNTAIQLRKLGLEIDIRLSDEKIEYSQYDLLHFFNIIRPDNILPHITRSNLPFVVSTIFVDYSEYEKKARGGLSAAVFRILPADYIEYLKAIARALVSGEGIKSRYFLFNGQRRSICKITRKASMLLPNSTNEYGRFRRAYGIPKEYRVIPNGIDPGLFNPEPDNFQRDNFLILCVARIEGLKNQLNLIRALTHTPYKLIIIGAMAPNQSAYYEQCKLAATDNVQFIDFINQEALLDYYMKAKVHVLPSWFETTGLSSLEAAAMGCNIVITRKGDAGEYFKDYAYYCDPESPDSILQAIRQAATDEVNPGLSSLVRAQYTWEVAAKRTLEAYEQILDKKVK
jgi:glycosyltransferase involved in cell wall biosynthesis